MELKLSNEATQLLATLFAKNSPLQLPVGVADVVVEIRMAVEAALQKG